MRMGVLGNARGTLGHEKNARAGNMFFTTGTSPAIHCPANSP